MASQEDIAHQQNLLQIYRRNVQVQARQAAMFTPGYVPPATLYGLREGTTQVARIKAILRGYGQQVEDLAGDTFDFTPYDVP